ncbi:MAG: alpha/beta fold hydrolase [Candidatus Nanohaloarchaea archaeon]
MRSATQELEYSFKEGLDPPVVFIHGWLGSGEFWRHITRRMEFENASLRYDQRAHGGSADGGFDIDSLAEDLERLLNETGLENPILVGHSMGGMVSLKYATRNSVSGLCLLGTCASTPEPEYRSVRYFLDRFESIERSDWAKGIAENYVGGSDEKMRRMTEKELLNADRGPIIDGLEAMVKYDVREELEGLEADSLVVAGEQDGAITMEKSRELAELVDAELIRVDTGHQMLPEAPDEISGLVQRFIRDCST